MLDDFVTMSSTTGKVIYSLNLGIKCMSLLCYEEIFDSLEITLTTFYTQKQFYSVWMKFQRIFTGGV